MNLALTISNCKKNIPSAQKELVECYSAYMLSITRRYLSDDHLAYDALQDAWISIFEHLNQYKEELGSFQQWISRIVVNQSLKIIRKRTNKTDYMDDWQGTEPEISEDAYRFMEGAEIMKLVQELPNGCREIFNLCVLDDYSHKEIASMLGISEGTSRSQLNRARQLLMARINELNTIKVSKE